MDAAPLVVRGANSRTITIGVEDIPILVRAANIDTHIDDEILAYMHRFPTIMTIEALSEADRAGSMQPAVGYKS